jgi:hypothetical protein
VSVSRREATTPHATSSHRGGWQADRKRDVPRRLARSIAALVEIRSRADAAPHRGVDLDIVAIFEAYVALLRAG